jgi:hypothetical protein
VPRLVIIAVLAAAVPAVLPMQTAGPAAAPLVERQPAEFLVAPPPSLGAETQTAHPYSIDPAAAVSAIDALPGAEPIAGWFDERELKPNAAGDDKSEWPSIPPPAFTLTPFCAVSPEAGTIAASSSPAPMYRKF